MSTAVQIAAQQKSKAPSPEAVADSEAVAAAHRSRTLAALFEEFRTTTPENARINSRAISTCHSRFPADNNALVGSLNHCDIVRQ